jgi:hypothetical protein
MYWTPQFARRGRAPSATQPCGAALLFRGAKPALPSVKAVKDKVATSQIIHLYLFLFRSVPSPLCIMKLLRGILLPALLALAPLAAAKQDQPAVEANPFEHEVVNLVWFDDSDVVLTREIETGIVWRSDSAGKNWKKADISALGIFKSQFDGRVAVAIGEKTHYVTYDRGEKWRKFKTEYAPSMAGPPVSFHAGDNEKIMYHSFEDCIFGPCLGRTYYTTDGFKSDPKLLRSDRKMCLWAKGSDRFLVDGDKSKEYNDRILCIARGKYSDRTKDFRILISDK